MHSRHARLTPSWRRTRRPAAGVARLMAATLVLASLGVTAPAGATDAASNTTHVPEAQAHITLTTTATGSGHGTPAGSWITTANGFEVGDDSPDDNVVSSNDTVSFDVDVQLEAGPARTVRLRVVEDEYFAPADTTARAWTLATGAVRTVSYSSAVTAKDTGGKVVEGVSPKIEVYVDNVVVHTLELEPVTIVSAPFADLVIGGGGSDDATTRRITVSPVALLPADTASNKGVSLGGDWAADLDVSDAPDDSRWFTTTFENGRWNDGATITPTDGKIRLTGAAGTPAGVVWIAPSSGFDEGSFDISLHMVPGSLSVPGGLQVNGDGTQPGDGLPKTTSTRGLKPGASAGAQYPNNDWTFISRYQTYIPDGPVFDLQHGAPNAEGSIFDDANLSGPAYFGSRVGVSRPNLAPATEGSVRLRARTHNMTPAGPRRIILGVEINRDLERFHHTDNVAGPTLNNKDIDPELYTIQWTERSGLSTTELTDLDSDIWHDGLPPADAAAARFVFEPETITQYGIGQLDADFGVRVLDLETLQAAAVPQDVLISREGFIRWFDGPKPGSGNRWSGYRISSKLSYAEDIESDLTISPGNPVTWQPGTTQSTYISLGAHGVRGEDQLLPRLEITYPTCVGDPSMSSYAAEIWDMQVIDPVPGDSGIACGDPTATPGRIILTLKESSDWIAKDHNYRRINQRMYTSRNLTLDFAVLTTSPGVTENFTGSLSWLQDKPVVPPIEAGSAAITIPALTDSTATVTYLDQINIGDAPTWSTFLVSTGNDSQGGELDTVIILPASDDGHLVAGVDNLANYHGPQASGFTTRPPLEDASFVTANTSQGTEGFYTDNPAPTFEPADSTWYPLAEAGQNGNPPLAAATALRIQAPSVPGRPTTVQFDISLQSPSDMLVGDAYVLWVGPTSVTASTEGSTATDIRRPWPAGTSVVQSEISGEIFWDNNGNSVRDDDDGPIAGVPVNLYQGDVENPSDEPYRTTVTDAEGKFTFHAPSGTWTVISMRGQALAEKTDMWGTVHTPQVTYTTHPRYIPNAAPLKSDVLAQVHLQVGGTTKVALGYQPQTRSATLTSSPITSDCLEAAGGEECTATWRVQVHNTGDTPLTGAIHTRTSDLAVEQAALEAKSSRWVQIIDQDYQPSYLLDATGRVWIYGTSDPRFTDPLLTPTGASFVQAPMPLDDLADYKVSRIIETKRALISRGLLFLDEDNRLFSYFNGVVKPEALDLEGNQVALAEVHAGYTVNHGIGLDGTVYSWSWDPLSYQDSVFGRPYDTDDSTKALPLIDEDGVALKATSLTVSNTQAFAVSTEGEIYAWGSASAMMLRRPAVAPDEGGYYDTSEYYERLKVPGLLQGQPDEVRFTEVFLADARSYIAEGRYIVATDEDGNLWTWGTLSDDSRFDLPTHIPPEAMPQLVRDADGNAVTIDAQIAPTSPADVSARSTILMRTDDARILEFTPSSTVPEGYALTQVFADTPLEHFSAILHTGVSNDRVADIIAIDAAGQLIWAKTPNSWDTPNYLDRIIPDEDQPATGEVVYVNLGSEAAKARFTQGALSSNLYSGLIDDRGVLYHMGMRQMGYFSTTPVVEFSTKETDASTKEIASTRTNVIDGFKVNSYPVDNILPGSAVTLEMTATLLKPAGVDLTVDQLNFLAQAWWDGPDTRIAALLPEPLVTPLAPVDPGTELEPEGIKGNPTCSTILDLARAEDTCDQVGSPVALAERAPLVTAHADNGLVGRPLTIWATGTGIPDATLTIEGLPEGVTYTTTTTGGVTTATFEGTPDPGTGGFHEITFTATNTVGTDTATIEIHVAEPSALLTIDGEQPTGIDLAPDTVVDLTGEGFTPYGQVAISDRFGNHLRNVTADGDGIVDAGTAELTEEGEHWFGFRDLTLDAQVETNRATVVAPPVTITPPGTTIPDPEPEPSKSPEPEPSKSPEPSPEPTPTDPPDGGVVTGDGFSEGSSAMVLTGLVLVLAALAAGGYAVRLRKPERARARLRS